MDAVLLRSLPVKQSDRLFTLDGGALRALRPQHTLEDTAVSINDALNYGEVVMARNCGEEVGLMGDDLLSPARVVLLQDKRHAEHGGSSHREKPECVDVRQSRSLQL